MNHMSEDLLPGGLELTGPRTVLGLLKSMARVGGGAEGNHLEWVRSGSVGEGDRAVYEDEVLCKVLQFMVTIDQVNVPNLVSAELTARRIQLLREAYRVSPSAPDHSGSDFYMGWGQRKGGGAIQRNLHCLRGGTAARGGVDRQGESKGSGGTSSSVFNPRPRRSRRRSRRWPRQDGRGRRRRRGRRPGAMSAWLGSEGIARPSGRDARASARRRIGPEPPPRQRDIFPLPTISSMGDAFQGSAKPGGRRQSGLLRRANEVVECLNGLSGHLTPEAKPLSVQQQAHRSILSQLARAPAAVPVTSQRAAVESLLKTSLAYDFEAHASNTVRPYDSDLASVPLAGHRAPRLGDVLDEAGREAVEGFKNSDAFSEKVERVGFTPYMDERLRASPSLYSSFARRLYDKGMIDFTSRPSDLATPFFVSKKDGRQRFVLDCRSANLRFKPSPVMAIPSGTAWASIEIPSNQVLYTAQSDIQDFFYSLTISEDLGRFFALPPVGEACLREWGCADFHSKCRPGKAWLYMRVVPMGWSWAFWLAQRVHSHRAIIASRLPVSRLLNDVAVVPDISDGTPVILAYCDDLNVAGTDRGRVDDVKDRIAAHFRQLGFGVHEEVATTAVVDSLGYVVDGRRGLVSPKPDKCSKLVAAFTWLDLRPRVSGRIVEILIGHAVHIMLLRRETLSALRGLYDFVSSRYDQRQRLWPVAAKEASWLAVLLPLCVSDLRVLGTPK